jgi:uncharacterized protein (TIGR03083 family)
VEDVVDHVAHVYLHKVECMRQQASPDPWPPEPSGRPPLALLRESFETLLDELQTRGPDAPSYTWHKPDQTVGFWYRRMAQETVVHRVDVEQAHGMATPADPELAADGVDELLSIMLAGDWSDEPVADADGARVLVVTGGRQWQVRLGRTQVEVEELAPSDAASAPGSPPDVTIGGEPSDVLLWTWGRASADQVTVDGDGEVFAAFRRRLALATQ